MRNLGNPLCQHYGVEPGLMGMRTSEPTLVPLNNGAGTIGTEAE